MKPAVFEFFAADRLSEVVDIGANPIDGPPHYLPMMEEGFCNVTGFEPQQAALDELNRNKTNAETYLPYAIGDGLDHLLHVCKGEGLTSLLEPDPNVFTQFNYLDSLSRVIEKIPITTKRLDDVAEIEHIDFLKMDIQGSELAVLQNGLDKLSKCVMIQVEVSFVCLYKNQPSIGDIDLHLRTMGFVPHCFVEVKRWPIAPFVVDNDPTKAMHQLLEADMAYIRDFADPEAMDNEQLKHLAILSACLFGSMDVALWCAVELQRRSALPRGKDRFLQLLRTHGLRV